MTDHSDRMFRGRGFGDRGRGFGGARPRTRPQPHDRGRGRGSGRAQGRGRDPNRALSQGKFLSAFYKKNLVFMLIGPIDILSSSLYLSIS